MIETKNLFLTPRLCIVAMVVALGFGTVACTVDSTLSKSKTESCQVLFEQAYPGEGERQAWIAGRDVPPEDWDAYREADKRGCAWLIEH